MRLIKKRIGLDATCFNQRQSGAKQRFISLYTELFKIMPLSKFYIFEAKDYNIRHDIDVSKFKNVNFIRTNINSKNNLINIIKSYFFWRKNLENYNLDIFETFRLPFFYKFSKITILTIHDLRYLFSKFSGYKKFFNFVYCKIFLRIVDQFIVVSNSTKKELKSKLNFSNITVIENGIDKKKFKNLSRLLKSKLISNTETKDKLIFTVGHFELRKNYLNLIYSIKKLKNFNVKLIIAGNSNSKSEIAYKKHLQNIIFKNKLNYRVKLLSNLTDDEIKILYKKCSLFIFPSIYEGFGIPVLEAISFNKKIILSNIAPFKEIIKYDKKIFFDPNNPSDIANKIKSNLKDKKINKKKYREILKFYQNRILALKIYDLYLKLIKKK